VRSRAKLSRSAQHGCGEWEQSPPALAMATFALGNFGVKGCFVRYDWFSHLMHSVWAFG
jgi:hypothetical protein